jgi:septal ring factor EnvC (AmiA/AmiB activator)
MIDKGGYEKELRRHNRAMEKLAGAKEKWDENEIAQKNKIAELRRQLSDANADINTTNKALDALRRVTLRTLHQYNKDMTANLKKFEQVRFELPSALTWGVKKDKYGGYSIPVALDDETVERIEDLVQEHGTKSPLYGKTLYLKSKKL